MARTRRTPLHENWRDYTKEELALIKKEKCSKCAFKGKLDGCSPLVENQTCDYQLITHNVRPHRPELCEMYKLNRDGSLKEEWMPKKKRRKNNETISA